MLTCRSDCLIDDFKDFHFDSANDLYSLLSLLPNQSRCYSIMNFFFNNGTSIIVQLDQNVTSSMFSKYDPVFLQIYRMINWTVFNSSNNSFPFDSWTYYGLTDPKQFALSSIYNYLNQTVSNITVSDFSIFKNLENINNA